MLTVLWRQAATAWGWLSDLDWGENNSHHQSRADAVLYSSCIDPCSCSKRMGFNISSPSFAMLITAFDMGSQDVLQVLNRSGQCRKDTSEDVDGANNGCAPKMGPLCLRN